MIKSFQNYASSQVSNGTDQSLKDVWNAFVATSS